MDIIREEHKSTLVKSRDGVPTPSEIRKILDDYVIGQEHATTVLSAAVHNHYKRLGGRGNASEGEIETSNSMVVRDRKSSGKGRTVSRSVALGGLRHLKQDTS